MAEPWRTNFITRARELQPAGEIRSYAHLTKSFKWDKIQNLFGITITILSVITGASFFTSFLKQLEFIIPYAALAVAFLSAITTYYKLGEKRAINEIAHKLYSTLCNDIKYFYEIECMQTYDTRREAERIFSDSYKKLNDRLSQLMQDSPILSEQEIKNAMNKLQLKKNVNES